MISAQINFLKRNKKSLSLLTFVFIIIASFLFINPQRLSAQVDGGARCRCADPAADGCACQVTTGGSVTRDFNGVTVICDPEVADSFFNQANPVCGNNAEVVPYCSKSYRDDLLFCWGTSFAGAISPGGIPSNTGGWYNLGGPTTISFNGGSWGGITEIWTCNAGLYCCGSNTCQEEGPEYGTCPSSGAPAPDSPAGIACEGIASNLAGIGESRLWFSQSRLVAALSSMSQTMFNPYGLNTMYQDSSFAKTATQAERDGDVTTQTGADLINAGSIDNKGGITTRIERHQGVDDNTQAVNQTYNNSSVIVGIGAPPKLNPFYTEFQDRACYIDETYSNPGDDLIGAKERGEMLFTKQFTVNTKGKPVEASPYKGGGVCTDDGGSFSIPYEEQDTYNSRTCTYQGEEVSCCSIDCCSTSCTVNKWSNPCEQLLDPGNPNTGCSVQTGGSKPFSCPREVDGDLVIFCCAEENQCIPPASVSVSCGTLPEVKLPVGGNANIYNKTPLVEYINDTVLEGEDSIYRRFMPGIDGDFEIEHLPSKSLFGATASVINFGTAQAGSFKLLYADGKVASPEMYIPLLGSLYKYWLVDFQKALKPESFSTSTQNTSDLTPTTTPPPPTSGDCTDAPEPYSSQLDATINAAISRYGLTSATSKVPSGVLKAIYFIESFGQWNSSSYDCSANGYGALGLMQITDPAYNWSVPPNMRMSDAGQCGYTPNFMSRCNPVDAIEIAARVLLSKVGLWDYGNFVPRGSISSRAQVYCSAAGYYGSTVPDTATDARARNRNVPPGEPVQCRGSSDPNAICDTNYSEVVCYDSGSCSSSADYPDPRPPAGSCLSNYP